ncbi:NUDIX hydrolase [Agrobacterium sp. rho-13.3]|uniref:NUDIX hydrolase n=1 Tax=Agrobacterium sp. rho-13.3 TaxID=3072980 RepID=UPI002A1801BC|nr:NUDIX hydrolase [Agrobacterium sp. rho-13.3]MDX8311402.1 NUDIX hydrolase [Agrobacterium sp. rho-13.3]
MNAVHFHFNDTETRFSTPVLRLNLPDEERRLIDEHWQNVNADGRFFNGTVLAGTALELNANPTIQISTSNYAHYLYSNVHLTSTPCRAVYSAVIIITSDNFLLLGEMASATSAPGRIQLVGGNIEISPSGTISGRDCGIREVEEEVGTTFLQNAKGLQPFCIKTGGSGDHIGVFYVLRLTLAANEASLAFEEHSASLIIGGEKPELARIHLVELTEKATADFCKSHSTQLVDYLAPLLTHNVQHLHHSQPT